MIRRLRLRYEGFEYEIRGGKAYGVEGAQRNEPVEDDAVFDQHVDDEDYEDEIIDLGEQD